MYQRAFQDIGVDVDRMPITKLKKDTLIKAKAVLLVLEKIIIKLEKEQNKDDGPDYDKEQELRKKCSEFSSKYYQMIPYQSNRHNMDIRPLEDKDSLYEELGNLTRLIEIEFSSKILFA